jgi:AAA+ superfamily predicted ATPase/ElaB/YqjD/DUF883 family membrane-anchored ribosome-binding protein
MGKAQSNKLFRDEIASSLTIGGVEYTTLQESEKLKAVENMLKDVLSVVDSNEQMALEKARKEKDEAQGMIGKLRDNLSHAEQMIKQHEDTVVDVEKRVYGHWNDVRYTFGLFMNTFFGATMVTQVQMSFFGKRVIPPAYEAMQVGPNVEDTVEVPAEPHWELPLRQQYVLENDPNWGRFCNETVDLAPIDGKPETKIMIRTTKRRRFFWDEVMKIYENFYRENSLFRRRIISSKFQFIRTDNVSWDDVILHPTTAEQVDDFLRAPIQHREYLKARGVKFKRGVLLSGKYGTGKSMLAKALANDARDHDITFIMVEQEHLKKLPGILHIAKFYAPAVVFCEDIDRLVPEERGADADSLLNTLDGVEDIGDTMVVFTTNHVHSISQALQRPGRIDEIITIGAADDAGRVKLIKKTITEAGNQYDPDSFDEERVAACTLEYPGSFLVEVVAGATMKATLKAARDDISMDTPLTISVGDIEWGAARLQKRAAKYHQFDPSILPVNAEYSGPGGPIPSIGSMILAAMLSGRGNPGDVSQF